jgi:hypothetical protein
VPDWKPEIRRRLANLQLEPAREAAIIEELAQLLADCYAESLSSGATEAEADQRTLAELSGSNCWLVNFTASSGQATRNRSFPARIGGQI